MIGGYTCGGRTFDALVFGYYERNDLMYVARTRNGFTARLREELVKRFRPLETDVCPFANLPEARGGRWGAGLTAAKMKDCRWLKPELVGRFEFTEWTPDDHVRHSRFVAFARISQPERCGESAKPPVPQAAFNRSLTVGIMRRYVDSGSVGRSEGPPKDQDAQTN